jgi:hypothetical protein
LSPTVALGLFFALVCALIGLLGFLMKERGAQGAPAVSLRHPLKSTFGLFTNRWWTFGIIVAMLAWVFHVAALALAPISLVQATIAAGLVLLTPMADRFFGHPAGRREWTGVGITAVGLLLLALTLGTTAQEAHDNFAEQTLWLYVGGATALAVLAALSIYAWPRWAGPALALSCGLMWGASDVTIKAASSMLGSDGVLILFTFEALVILVLSLVGFVIGARSLQIGPAVAVIAITTAAANTLTIASGALVFGEPVPDNAAAFVLRMLGFAMVITGAVITPTPQVEPDLLVGEELALARSEP